MSASAEFVGVDSFEQGARQHEIAGGWRHDTGSSQARCGQALVAVEHSQSGNPLPVTCPPCKDMPSQ